MITTFIPKSICTPTHQELYNYIYMHKGNSPQFQWNAQVKSLNISEQAWAAHRVEAHEGMSAWAHQQGWFSESCKHEGSGAPEASHTKKPHPTAAHSAQDLTQDYSSQGHEMICFSNLQNFHPQINYYFSFFKFPKHLQVSSELQQKWYRSMWAGSDRKYFKAVRGWFPTLVGHLMFLLQSV